MKSYKNNNNLKSGTIKGFPKGQGTKLYPKEVRDYINLNHKGVGPKEMTQLLNEKFNKSYQKKQLDAFYKNNKISSGLDGRFEKGHKPTAPIKRGERRSKETEFKKGLKPGNWLPIGTERINTYGYVDVKVADGMKQKNWKGKHIIIWEKYNGPLPKDHVIIFGDKDKSNLDIDNLLLVSRKQLLIMNRNKLIQDDTELTKTGMIIADMHSKILERKKNL
ncbi:MAG: HNH endonuclease [Clostridiales bacterium]|nr:HNH endonuclease [Clostridiales bacterium]